MSVAEVEVRLEGQVEEVREELRRLEARLQFLTRAIAEMRALAPKIARASKAPPSPRKAPRGGRRRSRGAVRGDSPTGAGGDPAPAAPPPSESAEEAAGKETEA